MTNREPTSTSYCPFSCGSTISQTPLLMFFLYCILQYRSCKAVCIELMYTCVHRNNCRHHPSTMLSSLTTRRWLLLAVVLMVIGILLAIGGCIIASVGFGLSAIDMYDYPNLWVFLAVCTGWPVKKWTACKSF